MSGTSVTLLLLITVKAAPNPSARHGETVCVGALSVDPGRRSWIRLYPIHATDVGGAGDDRSRPGAVVDPLAGAFSAKLLVSGPWVQGRGLTGFTVRRRP